MKGKAEDVLWQVQEEILHISDVTGGVGVEDDAVVEVGSDAVEALDDLVDDLDEPPWSSAASLWHSQPLEETRGCAESSERCRVLVHCYLMQRRIEVEGLEYSTGAEFIEGFVDSRNGELAKDAEFA